MDICIGISQDQLNVLSASVYGKLRTTLFTGEASLDFEGTAVNLHYDIAAAPTFDLSAQLDAAEAKAYLRASIYGQGLRASVAPCGESEGVLTALLDSLPSFALNLSVINITFSSGPSKSPMTVSAKVQASVASVGGKITFSVLSSSASSQGTPFQQWICTKFIAPKVQEIAQQLLGGLSIGIPSIPGVNLSPFNVGFAGGSLIAVAAANGPQPALPSNVPGLGAPFFIALDGAALQAAASSALGQGPQFFGNDTDGSSGFNVQYKYAFQAVNPVLSVVGNQVAAQFELSGSAGASAEIFWVGVSIGVNISTSSPPTAMLNVVPGGSQVSLVAASVSPFTVNVSLSGSVGSLLGWMVNWLLSAIANALKPQIVGYLNGLNVATLNVPTVTQSIDGVPITLTPALTDEGSADGFIVLTGSLSAS